MDPTDKLRTKQPEETLYPVLQRLVELWNLPPERRGPRHQPAHLFHWDRQRSVAGLVELLNAEFTPEVVEEQVIALLEAWVQRLRAGEILTSAEKAMGSCTLSLVASPDGAAISTELAREIVGSFPSLYYDFPIKKISAIYLRPEDVLTAIADGLVRQASVWNTWSCLHGLRAYREIIIQSRSDEAMSLRAKIQRSAEDLCESDDPRLRKAGLSGLRALVALDDL